VGRPEPLADGNGPGFGFPILPWKVCGKTTRGGGAGSPEGAGQGSGRVFVGMMELEVGLLGWRALRECPGVGEKRSLFVI
jgi:hypothetical protein